MDSPDVTRTGEPSEITSNEPGSFAWRVLHDRHPAIIQRIGDDLPYPPHIRRSLDSLRAELDGSIRPLRANAPDGDAWYHWMRDHTGENWYDVPFLWSESFFYRKLLEAVGYFEPGPWNGIDPFAAQKSAELEAAQTEDDLEQLGRLAGLPIADQISAALDAALWGNRADLGFLLSDPAAAYKERSRALVADDGKALRNLLAAAGLSRVSLVADNSGRELIADLVLIDRIGRAHV